MSTSPLAGERAAFEAVFVETGFYIPRDATLQALRAATVQPYIPTERINVGPEDFTCMSSGTQRYLQLDVMAKITRGIVEQDESILKLGHAAGRYLAATLDAGKIKPNPTFSIGQEKISVAGRTFSVTFDKKRVVEYGLGFNGLAAHVGNLRSKERPYTVAGLSKYAGEVALLDGMADYFGIGDAVINDASGIGPCLQDMLSSGSEYTEGVDLVAISSVHSRDPSFVLGVEKASRLLRSGGMLLAVGLSQSNKYGMGYQHVGEMIARDKMLDVEVFQDYRQLIPGGGSIPNTLTVAYKK